MKVWFFSDTHNSHREISCPEADIAVFCGDSSNHRDPYLNEHECVDFLEWYSDLPYQNKVFVPGNHDTALYSTLIDTKNYPNITFLIHEEKIINGLKFFGSPYTPKFNDWVYTLKRERMKMVWNNIPIDTSVLITHGPCRTILDLTYDNGELIQVGCKALLNKVMEIKPIVHAFGHIHSQPGLNNYGIYDNGTTKFVNCAVRSHREKIGDGFVLDL